ncbi:MAG TPA: DUF2239 family protein [Arenimonas sp.]|nr:DUF2239 family protein [Arenimonas sp.]HPO23393.1 DUF2239 family protein [Arenimonas sp.]
MDTPALAPFTLFVGHTKVASGRLDQLALSAKRAIEGSSDAPVLIFDNQSGRNIDIDIRGSDKAVLARLTPPVQDASGSEPDSGNEEQRGRGRPKLGVVPREVTLLPRHWEWLASQAGGASVVLRRLVEQARKTESDSAMQKKSQERGYHFLLAIAGDMPGFEEATRALFKNDRQSFENLISSWPADIKDHATQLAFPIAVESIPKD